MLKKPRKTRGLIPVLGLALVASLLLSGLAASSASAAEEHWYSCKKVGTGEGQYTGGCHTHAVGDFERIQLEEGTSTAVFSNNSKPFRLTYQIGLGKYTIECTYSSSAGSASVLNPKGGGAGTIAGSPALLTMSNCKYNPSLGTCTVLEGKVRAYESLGITSGQSVSFTAAGGTVLFSFETSCSGKFEITGTLTGSFDNETNSLVLNGSSGSGLKMSGVPVWIEGSIHLETTKLSTLFLM